MREQVERLDQGGAAPPAAPSASATVRACKKPVLAAVRGYCYGGGAVLAIACDIRIGAEDARFKFHGATYGQVAGGAILPGIVGSAKARELLFTGDEVDAQEALRIGLVNQVVAPDDILETAVAMAGRIAASSPQSVAAIRHAIDLVLGVDEAYAYEAQAQRELRSSDDSAARFRQAAARVVGSGGHGGE
jgi:enoyl-CoA hydratase/carnithine racemase